MKTKEVVSLVTTLLVIGCGDAGTPDGMGGDFGSGGAGGESEPGTGGSGGEATGGNGGGVAPPSSVTLPCNNANLEIVGWDIDENDAQSRGYHFLETSHYYAVGEVDEERPFTVQVCNRQIVGSNPDPFTDLPYCAQESTRAIDTTDGTCVLIDGFEQIDETCVSSDEFERQGSQLRAWCGVSTFISWYDDTPAYEFGIVGQTVRVNYE